MVTLHTFRVEHRLGTFVGVIARKPDQTALQVAQHAWGTEAKYKELTASETATICASEGLSLYTGGSL